jgi:hypothetical protein
MGDDGNRAYVMVANRPGKQQGFADEIMLKGLIRGHAVDMIDIVHGSFDFISHSEGSPRY